MTNGEGKKRDGFFKREGEWDGLKVFGAVIAILALIPFLGWLYEYVMHIIHHPGDDFNPALQPMDVWYMLFPPMALGLGLLLGFGREIVDTLLSWVKKHTS